MNQMMMQAMQALQEAQKRMADVQEKLKTMSITEEGGGGIVKVTASAEGRLTKLEVDPEALKTEEMDMLEDLIIATTNKALESATRTREREMAAATEGLIPNIPGLNLPFGMK